MQKKDFEKLDAISICEDEVFEDLFSIEDEIERSRTYNKLEERAKVLGCKTQFSRVYQAFNREFKKEQKRELQTIPEEPKSYVTNFSGVEDVLECGSWIATDNGIYTLTDKGMMFACSHPIYPTGILVNAETGEYKIVIRFKVYGKWREIVERRDVISSSNKIVSLAAKGVRVTSENAKALVKYLSDVETLNEDVVVEHVSTSRLGWIGKQFMPLSVNV